MILEREEGAERERDIKVKEIHQLVASQTHPDWRLEPTAYVRALTRNQTCNILVYGMTLQPAEPSSQG